MYFLCHSCGKRIRDDGRSLTIKCENCGEIIFSRAPQSSPESPPPRVYSFNEIRPTRPPNHPPYPPKHPPPTYRDHPPSSPAPVYQYQPEHTPYPPQPTSHQQPYLSGWHGQYPTQFRRSRSPISLLIHTSVLLLLIALLMNVLSLGPALVEVAENAEGSPGVGWLIFLVPYPPFIVSVDAFLYEQYGINVFLGSYAIVVYFIIIELAILLSCYYLFRKDGADLLCQLYNGVLDRSAKDVSELPFIGSMVKKRSNRGEGPGRPEGERREMWYGKGTRDVEEALTEGRSGDARSTSSTQHAPPAHHQAISSAGEAPQSFDEPWPRQPAPSPSFFSNENNKFGSEDNAIILTLKLFMVGVFINVMYNIITLLVFGGGVEEPEFLEEARFWQLVFGLARASVYEEVLARILLLGVPLYFFHRSFNKKAFARSKGIKNYLFGRGLEIDKWTLLFLLFSSVVFGLAHLEGWNIYKVVPTAIVGLTMGYLFIKKGLPASILLHFMFNYLSVPYQLFNPANLTIVFIGIVSLVSIITGMLLTIYYCARIWNWLTRLHKGKRNERRTGQWRW